MLTNDLKKGTEIMLKNGWKARIEDNLKGNTRLATVYGDFTEMGSVYAHDIAYAIINGQRVEIELTDKQKQLQKQVRNMGW